MRYAWIENNCIRDICLGGFPSECYHPDVAKYYDTQVPDDAVNGDGWIEGVLIKKEITPLILSDILQEKLLWSLQDVRDGLTLAEKVRWDNDLSGEIKTAKIELATPQNLVRITEVLQFLVDANDISQASMNKILS